MDDGLAINVWSQEYVERMDDRGIPRSLLKDKMKNKQPPEKPRNRWEDSVDNQVTRCSTTEIGGRGR